MLSRFWRWLAGVLALLLPVMYILGRKDQATRTKGKEAIKDADAQDRGRKAVQSGFALSPASTLFRLFAN